MTFINTENRIQAMQSLNRMQAKALLEFNNRAHYYNQHAELLAALNVFANSRHCQVAVCDFLLNPHPVVYIVVDIEDLKEFEVALKQFFTTQLGQFHATKTGGIFEFQGLQHLQEKPLHLSIIIQEK